MPTFQSPEPVHATIDMASGTVRLNAGDRADTVVEVRPSDPSSNEDVQAAEQVRVEYANGRLSVRQPKTRSRLLFWRNPSIQVTIDLPAGSDVDAHTWADVRSTGRLGTVTVDRAVGNVHLEHTGRVKLHTAAGDASVGKSIGHADISTAAGKIWIGEIDGTAVAKTSAGDVTVGTVTGDLRAKTAHGDITVDRAPAGVDAKTAAGSIRIGEVRRGSAVLETAQGDLEVGIAGGTAAWLDVHIRYRGTVHNLLEPAESPAGSEETVEVRARTGLGDITIRRP